MTLSVSKIREQIASWYSDCEEVDNTVIRFTRKTGGIPFAVCYLDVTDNLPTTQELLTRYQDRVVGSRYFEGEKSLQWNNYLYFVISPDRMATAEVRQARALIERDRSYARKYVISGDEIESALGPQQFIPAAKAPHRSVMSVWVDALTKSGLDRAILTDADLPTRVKLIEAPATRIKAKTRQTVASAQHQEFPFIRSFEIRHYRSFPLIRNFPFKSVNLIFGPNGTGKTSLLEAIELFYCGRNKRNPNATLKYEFSVSFSDSRTEVASDAREAQVFRERNLAWYGRAEVKTNYLYQGFSQFNFLNTDAAASLSQSTEQMEDDLSKLLVGPEAAKVWRDIERVYEAVEERLKSLGAAERTTREELASVQQQMKKAGEVDQASDVIKLRLEEMVYRVGWPAMQGDMKQLAGQLVADLAEFVPFVEKSSLFGPRGFPSTKGRLVKFLEDGKAAASVVQNGIARLEVLRENRQIAQAVTDRCQEALKLLAEWGQLADAGVASRAKEMKKCQAELTRYANWLSPVGPELGSGQLSGEWREHSLLVCAQTVSTQLSAAEREVATARGEYKKFVELQERSKSLGQQLRQIAASIREGSPCPDECPLCHTRFNAGELDHHINLGLGPHDEDIGRSLSLKLQEREAVVGSLTATKTALSQLRAFCDMAGRSPDTTIDATLKALRDVHTKQAQLTERMMALARETQTIEEQGFSNVRLARTEGRLHELGYSIFSSGDAEQISAAVRAELTKSAAIIDDGQNLERKLTGELVASLRQFLPDSLEQDISGSLAQLRETIAALELLRFRLDGFSNRFPWPDDRPLAELLVEAEAICKVATELHNAVSRELQANLTRREAQLRENQLTTRLGELATQTKRFRAAQKVLGGLRGNHSLAGAVETTLKENRSAIEHIFTRIHSPPEFHKLGESLGTLIRTETGQPAALSEISTGQRAAYALSIFLAQNDQAAAGPRLMLIDDPISHIDDLNALSFLDYLREVALNGRRQIFFATASEKLATLFERKFDFLSNDGFRRFDLSRETDSMLAEEV